MGYLRQDNNGVCSLSLRVNIEHGPLSLLHSITLQSLLLSCARPPPLLSPNRETESSKLLISFMRGCLVARVLLFIHYPAHCTSQRALFYTHTHTQSPNKKERKRKRQCHYHDNDHNTIEEKGSKKNKQPLLNPCFYATFFLICNLSNIFPAVIPYVRGDNH